MRDLDDDERGRDGSRQPGVRAREERIGRALPRTSRRERVVLDGRDYSLRESQVEVLETLGRFGPTHVGDLDAARHGDLDSLVRQGLVERTSVSEHARRNREEVAALTAEGRRFMTRAQPEGRPYRSGFGRRRELAHDACFYRAYRDAAARIEAAGGRVERVSLDSELKQAVYAKARDGERDLDPEELRQARAEGLGLPVVDGHVQFPDLHITYRDREGERQQMAVDVVTDSYKAHHIGAKTRAGFHLVHAPHNTKARGGMRDERQARDLFER
jgi:DNA-binding MarR family transcriptional regulator